MSPLSFDELMRRVRTGDQDAVGEFAARYSPPIREYVDRFLDHRNRAPFDVDDGVNLVLSAFFRAALLKKTFADDTELLAYLRGMAQFCMNKENRRLSAARRDVDRQVVLPANLPAANPSPDQVAEDHDS